MQSQDPDQQRNLLLAVVLSMAVLLGWQFFYAGPKMQEEQARQRAQQELASSRRQARPPPSPSPAAPGAAGRAPPRRCRQVSREDAIKLSPRVAIDTPSLQRLDLAAGGRFDDLVLVKYHETVDPKSPNVVLLSPSDSPHPYFAEYGWVPAERLNLEGARPRYALAVSGRRR